MKQTKTLWSVFWKRIAYNLKLYKLHPRIAEWVFVDHSPLTARDIARAHDLIAQHPEWEKYRDAQ